MKHSCTHFNPMYLSTECEKCHKGVGVICGNGGGTVCRNCHPKDIAGPIIAALFVLGGVTLGLCAIRFVVRFIFY